MRSVAVPLFDRNGKIVAAMKVVAPTSRASIEDLSAASCPYCNAPQTRQTAFSAFACKPPGRTTRRLIPASFANCDPANRKPA
ncbi:hypothetical protein ACF1BQ_046495 [Bradyrhizobium sp. RDT10]